jgi:hypothetical protein
VSGHSRSVATGTSAGQDTSGHVSVSDNRFEAIRQCREMERVANSARTVAQRQAFSEAFGSGVSDPRPNTTGMPDTLKTGLESLSGMDLSDVKVHYNSSKPASLQALAYARGNNIHLAPGQEEHLPHEGWHVVQQRQGRVEPTLQLKGVAINDNSGLEREAEAMGHAAAHINHAALGEISVLNNDDLQNTPVQLMKGLAKDTKVFIIKDGREGIITEVIGDSVKYKIRIKDKAEDEEFDEGDVSTTPPPAKAALPATGEKKDVSPAPSMAAAAAGSTATGTMPDTAAATSVFRGTASDEEKGGDTKAKYAFESARASGDTRLPAAPFQLATIQFSGAYDISAYEPEIIAYARKCESSKQIPVIEFRLYDAAFKGGIVRYKDKAREKLRGIIKSDSFDIIFSLLRDETMESQHIAHPYEADPAMEFVKRLLESMDDIGMEKWKDEWKQLFSQTPKTADKTAKLGALNKPKLQMLQGGMMVPVEEALEYLVKATDTKALQSLHHKLMNLLITGVKGKLKGDGIPSGKVRRNSDAQPDTLTLTNLVTGKDPETLASTIKACKTAFLKGASQVFLIIETTRAANQIEALTKEYNVEVIKNVDLAKLGAAQQSGVDLNESLKDKQPPERVKIRVTRKEFPPSGAAGLSSGSGSSPGDSKDQAPKGILTAPAGAAVASATATVTPASLTAAAPPGKSTPSAGSGSGAASQRSAQPLSFDVWKKYQPAFGVDHDDPLKVFEAYQAYLVSLHRK